MMQLVEKRCHPSCWCPMFPQFPKFPVLEDPTQWFEWSGERAVTSGAADGPGDACGGGGGRTEEAEGHKARERPGEPRSKRATQGRIEHTPPFPLIASHGACF